MRTMDDRNNESSTPVAGVVPGKVWNNYMVHAKETINQPAIIIRD